MTRAPRFDIRIEWDTPEPEGTAFSATAGKAAVSLGDACIWGKKIRSKVEGIHWTWVDLLAFLSENWVALTTEETPPAFPAVKSPHLLRREAERKWDQLRRLDQLDEERFLDEEEQLFYFEERHDLSRAVPGKAVPNLFIVRSGTGFVVSSGSGPTEHHEFSEIVDHLEQVGEAIAARLEGLSDPIAAARCDEWRRRWPELDMSLVSLSTGASESYLLEISEGKEAVEFWGEGRKNFQDNVFMALARMGARAQLSTRSVKAVLPIASANRPQVSDHLAELNFKALNFIQSECLNAPPAEQGRALAHWFRSERSKTKRKKVDPEKFITEIGAEIKEVVLPESDVDALSCWRPGQQPVVLINISSTRNQRISGKRAALAHELCHIIIDYNKKVPFVEVIKGNYSDQIEQRARGFAAELLMPRQELKRQYDTEESIANFVDRMSGSFDVSPEIVAWQIRRSDLFSLLSKQEVASLKRYVSNAQDMDD